MKQPAFEAFDDLPFSSQQFKEIWSDWVAHRKERKQALTPTTRKYQLKKLASMGEARAIAALDNSILNGYQGIFEPTTQNGRPQHKSETKLTMDNYKD